MDLPFSSHLVGREAQLSALAEAIDGGGPGAPGAAVVLVGEAGVGKSRLRQWTEERARQRGVRVLAGRAVDGSAMAFRPLAEALGSGFREEGAPREPAVTALLPTLARLVPHWSERVARDTSALGIAEAVLRLLEVAGRDRPCLLVVEDLHWADADTLAVLEYLIDNRAAHRALVLLTVRPEPSPARSLVRQLADRRAVTVMDVPGLGHSDVDAMVLDCLGTEAVTGDLAEFIRDNADGLPFLVEELLGGLARSGTLVATSNGWTVTGPLSATVPVTLAETVAARLGDLTREHRRVVQAAALLGREFDWRLLPAIVDQSDRDVLDALEAAGAVHLLATSDAVLRFRHALTRDAVVAQTLGPERADLARRALAVLGVDDPLRVAELALVAGEPDVAADFLCRAAEGARDRGALATAAGHLTRAQGLVRDPDIALRVTENLAAVRAVAGDVDEAVSLAQEAMTVRRERGDPAAALAELELVLGRAMVVAGSGERARRHAQAVLADSTAPHVRARALVLIAQVEVNAGRLDEAQRLARQAQQLAAEAGTTTTELAELRCEALEVIGRCQRAHDVNSAERTFAEALAEADRAELILWRARALHELGTIDLLDRMSTDRLVAARRAAIEAGAPALAAVADFHAAAALVTRNSIADGRVIALRSIDVAARLRLPVLPYALTMLARSYAHERDHDAVDEVVARVRAAAPDDPEVAAAVHSHVYAMLALHEADRRTLRHQLDAAAVLLRANPGQHDPNRGLWALLHTVDGDGAAQRAEVAASNGADTRFNRATLTVADAVVAGRSGDTAAAESLFASGVAQLRGYQGGEWMAQAVIWLVATEAHRSGWGDPVGDLTGAVRWFAGHGYEPLASACRRELREIGAPVPRAGRGESTVPAELVAAGVTSREVDVLRLVAAGLTNREIATRLVLSPKTVEKHVASLLLKTGQADRRGLRTAYGTYR